MNKNPVKSTIKFVKKHRVAIAVVATATPLLAINHYNAKLHNDLVQRLAMIDNINALLDEIEI